MNIRYDSLNYAKNMKSSCQRCKHCCKRSCSCRRRNRLCNFTDGNSVGAVRGINTASDCRMGINAFSIGENTAASGRNSFASGNSTAANGLNSYAGGGYTNADGPYSFATGYNTASINFASNAEGASTMASGDASHAEGNLTTASGTSTHAEGDGAFASGFASHAEGLDSVASSLVSHAQGYNTVSEGFISHAQGSFTVSSGYASHAANYRTVARNFDQTAIGRYNNPSDGELNLQDEDDAFIIGNGHYDTRSNAFRVQFNGNAHMASIYTEGENFAEMFEWLDGNPSGEDRRGYFVTLNGKYIRKATAEDKYILGVVSGASAIVGNAKGNGWHGRYLKNEWDSAIYEEKIEKREFPVVDRKTGRKKIITENFHVQRPKINSQFDKNKTYIPRSHRKEWAAVGLVGQVTVRDDGCCRPDGFCTANNQGIAVASAHGYRVLERISSNRIKILLK